jgi:hypothetical protein
VVVSMAAVVVSMAAVVVSMAAVVVSMAAEVGQSGESGRAHPKKSCGVISPVHAKKT